MKIDTINQYDQSEPSKLYLLNMDVITRVTNTLMSYTGFEPELLGVAIFATTHNVTGATHIYIYIYLSSAVPPILFLNFLPYFFLAPVVR